MEFLGAGENYFTLIGENHKNGIPLEESGEITYFLSKINLLGILIQTSQSKSHNTFCILNLTPSNHIGDLFTVDLAQFNDLTGL